MDGLVIALAGNPNVGKSTVFNSLTGLKQHTGNWAGKTVAVAQGKYCYKEMEFILVDLPGTYSLMSSSSEEEVARNFVCFGSPDATLVVADATCLERNLNLVLQIIEITDNVVLCINLLDEAERKKIKIDLKELSNRLGVPVVGVSARNGSGLEELKDAVYKAVKRRKKRRQIKITYDPVIEKAIGTLEPCVNELADGKINSRWTALRLLEGEENLLHSLSEYIGYDLTKNEKVIEKLEIVKELLKEYEIDTEALHDRIVSGLIKKAEEVCDGVVSFENKKYDSTDRKIDRLLTSKLYGIPLMLVLTGAVFWLTIVGANYPSELLTTFFFWLENQLMHFFIWMGSPEWLRELLVSGMYRTVAWVIAVMLPPMAIFFPLFSLLEDFGYLPRIAFNLDCLFKKACAHGKQALTMCMGFGCNAAGVTGCRIIDSPRERLIAIITNNFVPCNGRFPFLIALSAIFAGSTEPGIMKKTVPVLVVLGLILLGISMTLIISKLLSKTILRGLPSSFVLELPPYRKPQIGRIIVRSVFDRTLFVLARAVSIAAPAGLVIWVFANIDSGGISLLTHGAMFFEPFAKLIGMDGYILMAFILGLPANEIVLPIIIMSYTSGGELLRPDSLVALELLLKSHGWTWVTTVCVMLFSLMHFPCGTTLLTIRHETRSLKWTLAAFLIPTFVGVIMCFIFVQSMHLLGFY